MNILMINYIINRRESAFMLIKLLLIVFLIYAIKALARWCRKNK